MTEEEFQHANDLVRLPCSAPLCTTTYQWLKFPCFVCITPGLTGEPAQVSAYCFSFALAAGERTRMLLPVLVCPHAQPILAVHLPGLHRRPHRHGALSRTL